jgi:CheY-like chemotaxis protein
LILKTIEKQLRQMSNFDNQSVQYVTTLCSDPFEASRLLQGGYEFDLVLCDIYMPSVDGFAVLDLIKSNVSSSMHVALMSSSAQESTRIRGLRAGAVRVLTKPLQFEDFRELWHQVELRRSSNSDSTTPFEFQHHHDHHRHHQQQQQQQQLPTLPSSKLTSGIATSRTSSVMLEDPSTSVAGKASPVAGNSMLSSVLKVLDDASEGRQPDRQQAQNARNAVQQGYLLAR